MTQTSVCDLSAIHEDVSWYRDLTLLTRSDTCFLTADYNNA